MPLPSSRRTLLTRGATLVAMTAAPGWLTPALAQTSLRPTPSQTEGPFYPVSLPVDRDFDLLRNGQVAYDQGQVAWIEGTVTDTRGVPLGGGVVEAMGSAYVNRVLEQFCTLAFKPVVDAARIVEAQLGDDAGVLGAALIARERLTDR